jgi:hypothetical protein
MTTQRATAVSAVPRTSQRSRTTPTGENAYPPLASRPCAAKNALVLLDKNGGHWYVTGSYRICPRFLKERLPCSRPGAGALGVGPFVRRGPGPCRIRLAEEKNITHGASPGRPALWPARAAAPTPYFQGGHSMRNRPGFWEAAMSLFGRGEKGRRAGRGRAGDLPKIPFLLRQLFDMPRASGYSKPQ